MTWKRHGTGANSIQIQPNRRIMEKNDGTMTGSVMFRSDASNVSSFPRTGTPHPDDGRLLLYSREFTFQSIGLVEMKGEYFGIWADPSPYVITWPGAGGRDPIETHPDFATFAGAPTTSTAPDSQGYAYGLNGAKFRTDNDAAPYYYEFIGFTDPAFPEWYGVNGYLVAEPLLYVSYWTAKEPGIPKVGKIRRPPVSVKRPDNVKNWLLIGAPYRQIGDFFQVTEQYKGSGPNGWNEDIYGDE